MPWLEQPVRGRWLDQEATAPPAGRGRWIDQDDEEDTRTTWQKLLAAAGGGLLEGAASIPEGIGRLSAIPSRLMGAEKEGSEFGWDAPYELAQKIRSNAPDMPEGVGYKIVAGVAQAPGMIAKYAPLIPLGPLGAAAGIAAETAGEAYGGGESALSALGTGALTGAGALALGPLSKARLPVRTLGNAAIGAGTAAIEGGTPEDIAASAATMGGIGALMKPKKRSETTEPKPPSAAPEGEARWSRYAPKAAEDATALGQIIDDLRGRHESSALYMEKYPELAVEGHKRELLGDPFYKAEQPKPETYTRKVSEQDVDVLKRGIEEQRKTLSRLHLEASASGSQEAAARAKALYEEGIPVLDGMLQDIKAHGTAWGRQGLAYKRGVAEAADFMARVAPSVENIQRAGARPPIFPEMKEILSRAWEDKALSGKDALRLLDDSIKGLSMNLFSVTSATLDTITDTMQLVKEAGGSVGRDIFTSIARGKPTAEATASLLKATGTTAKSALTRGKPPQIAPSVTNEMGTTTFGGEPLTGGFGTKYGVFTYRDTPVSAAVDYLIGAPAYAKGWIDNNFRSIGALKSLNMDAAAAANRAGITDAAALRTFKEHFVANPPKEAIERAAALGNKLGFNVELSKTEQLIAGNPATRLFIDAFPRWPLQFTRAMLDFFSPDLIAKGMRSVGKGPKLTPGEVGEMFGKAATGIGGYYALTSWLSPERNVDFKSMEYVKENGDRVRLNGRSPIPETLFIWAVLNGETEKAQQALPNISFPVKWLSSFQGLLTGMTTAVQDAVKRGSVDPKGATRELVSFLNQAIPGQAVLKAVASIVDPIQREGVGSKLPGASLLYPPSIQRTTGEPRAPQQYLPGTSEKAAFPQLGGVAIPGATRKLDPLERIFSKYPGANKLVYRGPRAPIGGMAESQLPPEIDREWQIELGRQRQAVFSPYLTTPEFFDSMPPDRATDLIRALDNKAAERARTILRMKYGRGKPAPRPAVVYGRDLGSPSNY